MLLDGNILLGEGPLGNAKQPKMQEAQIFKVLTIISSQGTILPFSICLIDRIEIILSADLLRSFRSIIWHFEIDYDIHLVGWRWLQIRLTASLQRGKTATISVLDMTLGNLMAQSARVPQNTLTASLQRGNTPTTSVLNMTIDNLIAQSAVDCRIHWLDLCREVTFP